MHCSLKVALAISSLVILLAVSASAQTQITIGASTGGAVDFTSAGAGSANLSFVGSCGYSNCVQGNAYAGASAGSYNLWITGNNPILTATADPNLFAVNMNGGTINFSFNIGGNTLAGTVVLTTLKDGSDAPQFLGTLKVSSATGSFASLWSNGSIVPLDMTVSLPNGSPFVDQVVAGTRWGTSGSVSSGEVLVTTPEPASIALIGSGLLAIGSVLKRRLRR
jgi:hypothetical protein